MPSSGIIDLALGLTFVFGVTAALSSAVTELIARFLGLRGAYLLTGLRELVDSGQEDTKLGSAVTTAYQDMQSMIKGNGPVASPSVTGALLGGPILSSQGMAGQISSRDLTLKPASRNCSLPKMTTGGKPWSLWSLWSQRRSLPSYIPAKSFADAVIDLLVPNAAGQTTMSEIQAGLDKLASTSGPFRPSLQALAKSANNDATQFRAEVEQWYDDHMDRVSGWYKRRVAKITLVIGAVLVTLLNINALTIGRTLYTQNTVSTALSTVAASGHSCPAGSAQETCLATLQGELSAAATAGLPIGWGTVRDCTEQGARCNWLDQRGIFSRNGDSGWQFMLVLIGFLIMLVAITPGAQFWFGILSKLGSLRSTGPKPAA